MIDFTIKHIIDSMIVRYAVAHRTRSSIKTKITICKAGAKVACRVSGVIVISPTTNRTCCTIQAPVTVSDACAEVTGRVCGVVVIA